MKRLLLLYAILLLIISCSKENLDKQEDLTGKTDTELKSLVKSPDLDSIAKMNAGGYLAGNLTVKEIDSLAKIRNIIQRKSSKNISAEGPEYNDWSGLIHLQVFTLSSDELHEPIVEVTVPADYVLVGGGAEILNADTYGAFLTESRPNSELTTWIAKSKDHINSDTHILTAYAIGMKIDGVTSDYLRSKMQVFENTSSEMNHPTIFKTIPSNYLLIGGGAWDDYNGEGNMLVSSYPSSSNTWTVSGKDHRRADPSEITAYAIGIENISFPTVGYIQVNYTQTQQTVSSGQCTKTVDVPTGWGITCSGGRATYNNTGRMIKSNYPSISTINQSIVVTRDHTYSDGGVSYVYALRVQKAQ